MALSNPHHLPDSTSKYHHIEGWGFDIGIWGALKSIALRGSYVFPTGLAAHTLGILGSDILIHI